VCTIHTNHMLVNTHTSMVMNCGAGDEMRVVNNWCEPCPQWKPTTMSLLPCTCKIGRAVAVGDNDAGYWARKGNHVLKATHPPRECGERKLTCKATAPPCEKPATTIRFELIPWSISVWMIWLIRLEDSSKPVLSSGLFSSSPKMSLHP
jgi:hypothetical protein